MSDDKEYLKTNNPSEETDEKENKDQYEKICFMCRRPESKAGKMIDLPNDIHICTDCMQRSFDTMNNSNINYDELMRNMPNISMIDLSSLQNQIPNRQKVKKKQEAPKEKVAPKVFDIKSIPAPHKIKASLDEYVIGQEKAKKVMSVAVYNHYKRVFADMNDDVEIEKSNMLMIGPTGSGKTYLVKTLARLLDVPLAITDATSLTEAGYIGDDIESVVSKLLAAADNDVERAEHGIIFIDEIDKIAKKKNTNQRDVSGEAVQQGMLKLLEGSEIEVPVGANSKNAMVPLTTVNTKNILFICGGAFPDLEEIIKERLNKTASIGFQADLKDKYDHDNTILEKVTVDDIKKAGKLVMATDAAWAPFEYIADTDTPVGSDIDLAQAIADQWGVELEIINTAFDTLPQYLDNGKADIVIAAMTITDERKEQMAFSDPYTVSTQYIIVNEADTSVKTIEDLAGKKVAVHLGTTGDFLVSDEIADGCLKDTGAEVVQYKNLTEGCLALQKGDVDAVMLDLLAAQNFCAVNDGLTCFEAKYADGSSTKEEYGIGVKKSNTELVKAINEAIKPMVENGSIDASIEKHKELASLLEQ